MSESIDTVTDAKGKIHTLTQEIGSGGQGKVLRTSVRTIAVKLAIDADTQKTITDPAIIHTYQKQIEKIKALPIPTSLPITIPSIALKEQKGYIMEMLPNMHSWKDAFMLRDYNNSVEKWPQFYQNLHADGSIDPNIIELWVTYTKTGSAKQRFLCLFHVAVLLQQLHGRGILFGDVSDNNVYISKEDLSNIWLIDADNLRFDRKKLPRGAGFFTPGFGPPELFWNPAAYHIGSDCHAFAVMAFETLTGIHPFFSGPMVTEHPGNDWDNSSNEGNIEDLVNQGEVPWIGDRQDTRNNFGGFLERDNIFNAELLHLFDRTFTEGRQEPWKRPSVFHWSKSLLRAHDKHLVCDECKMSFDAVENTHCSWCDAPAPSYIKVQSIYAPDFRNKDSWREEWELVCKTSDLEDTGGVLSQYLFEPFSATSATVPFVQIKMEGVKIILQKKTHVEILISKTARKKNKAPTSKMGFGVHSKELTSIRLYAPQSKRLITITGHHEAH